MGFLLRGGADGGKKGVDPASISASLNGADELYGLKIGDFDHVWWYEPGMLGFATVPKPSAATLFGLGTLGLAGLARRRRSG